MIDACPNTTTADGPMADRIRLRASAAPLIRPGENVQVMFQAQTASPYVRLIGPPWPYRQMSGYRVVIVTDQRILVCNAGHYRTALIRGIRQELPRATRIGPPRGFWWRCDSLGERLYVHRQFHQAIRAACG